AAGADDHMRLWLNNEILISDKNTAEYQIRKFQHVIGARLKKGRNFLLAKVGNLGEEWQICVTLFPHNRAMVLADENAVNPLFQSVMVPAGQPLLMRGDLSS